jgi:hypothetical protein
MWMSGMSVSSGLYGVVLVVAATVAPAASVARRSSRGNAALRRT